MADDESNEPEESNEEEAFDPSDILGQDDIDSLLQQVQGDDEGEEEGGGVERRSPIIGSDGRRFGADERVMVEPYDFRNPAFLGETEMRRLRLMHEDFIRFLEARFSLFLRMDFTLTMTKLTTTSYEQVIEEVDNPTHLVLFRAQPMPGMGFLEINPRLGLTVASSILGGKGQPPRTERYLTKIEVDLIEEFLIVLLQEWCGQWKLGKTLEPQITGHEVVANILQICEHDTVMLALTMEGQLRGAAGKIGIYVPLYMIEDAVKHMHEEREKGKEGGQRKVERRWRPHFAHIPVQGEAVVRLGQRSVREIREWKVGTVIEAGNGALESVQFNLAGLPIFECEAGAEGEHVALRIRNKIGKRGE